jgi:DNA-binding CsgD family transcriptional regulator
MPVATRWPLVGRRDELDIFTSALDDPDCQAVCIYGRSGVGKTRLADECLVVAGQANRRVLRASPDPSSSAVPLSPLAHLLPAGAVTDWQGGDEHGSVSRTRMLSSTLRSLAPTAGESGPPVLLVDDAHRFDRSSLAVVDQLLVHGAVFGVATINSAEPVPETITLWWRTERAVRIDLGDLDPIGVDTLLHVALEGPLDSSASTELSRASHGNVFVLRELVLGALATGSLVNRAGVWRLDGPLGPSDELREVVTRRIDTLSPPGRAVIELLAVCQPVGLPQLESSFGFEALEQLERDGLIAVRADGRRHSVRLAHPMHAEVVRARLPESRARAITLSQADELERSGARRREDPARIATMRLEATGHADPALLRRGARLALADHDVITAVRLARASFDTYPTVPGALVLGEALLELGAFDDADSALADAMTSADGADEYAAIAGMRRRNLYLGCGRPDDATAVADVAMGAASTASGRAELLAGEAELLVHAGRPRDGLALLDRVDTGELRVGVLAATARSAALAATGRTAEALEQARLAQRDHLALGDPVAMPSAVTHRVNEMSALVAAGELQVAEELGRAWFEASLSSGGPLESTWLALHLARCTLLQGRPRSALRWSDRAASGIEAHRLDGFRPLTAAIRAVAHAHLGDSVSATDQADDAERATRGFGALAVEVPLGRAWATFEAGDASTAQQLLVDGAEAAVRDGFVPAAAWLLHDACRVGATDVAPRLADLSAQTDSALVHLRAAHAAALADGDADRLADVADGFERLGAILLAAEAAAHAAASFRRQRGESQAVSLQSRSAALAARCEGASTPALRRTRSTAVLSSRERDVAQLAAGGLTSRAIAERLALSARTVDNHLGRVYTKLGVASRAELADILGPDRPQEGPA